MDNVTEEKLNKEEPKKVESKWKGYKPVKGQTPPWDPFNPEHRKKRTTIRERKFLAILSTTGSLQDAYRGAYKVKPMGDRKLESARVTSQANQILRRLRDKVPELVEKFTFEDITPDFVKKGILDLNKRARDKGDLNIEARTWELMGKMNAMFTDKQIVDTKIREVVDHVYRETMDDMPMKDERIGRGELEDDLNNIGRA